MRNALLAAVAALSVLGASANAADIYADKSGAANAYIIGEILLGDEQKFADVLRKYPATTPELNMPTINIEQPWR